MTHIQSVLFDLDGTLLDTAPDLVFALNQLRKEFGLLEIGLVEFRGIASHGSKAMIKQAFGVEESDPRFLELRQKFISFYEDHIADATQFFPEIENVLFYLEERKIPWGIVTNKLTRHTTGLLKALRIDHRPAVTICGDTLSTYKPDPQPILHACSLMKQSPANCLFIGDAAVDVIASKAAGTKSLVALYGYIGEKEDPYSWQADGYIKNAGEIIEWLGVYNR